MNKLYQSLKVKLSNKAIPVLLILFFSTFTLVFGALLVNEKIQQKKAEEARRERVRMDSGGACQTRHLSLPYTNHSSVSASRTSGRYICL